MQDDGLRDFVRAARSVVGLFDAQQPLSVARAPGRLDVMGGIADYSGSLVLEMPIRESAYAAAQRTSDGKLRIASHSRGTAREVVLPLAELVSGAAQSYKGARAYFARDPSQHWHSYLAGALLVLRLERGVDLGQGMRLFLSSDVPEGKGVSSSAAIEVATMQAVAHELGVSLEPLELALLCQKVENLVAGAPCGVMDQMTCAHGEQGRLLELLCQPASILGHVKIPSGVAFFGIDSGERHAVTGSDYRHVRCAAFMGSRIVSELSSGDLPSLGGYLANVTPSSWQEYYAERVPEQLLGRAFLARYARTNDSVTRVEPNTMYAVRAATAHPIFEHFRVRAFAELLAHEPSERTLELLGELMLHSHLSYSACGLGSKGTDRLVRLVRLAGPASGLYGAKITGGGCGGTVAVLARESSLPVVEAIARRYAEETGREPYVFRGSSPGAVQSGVHRATRDGELERVRLYA